MECAYHTHAILWDGMARVSAIDVSIGFLYQLFPLAAIKMEKKLKLDSLLQAPLGKYANGIIVR